MYFQPTVPDPDPATTRKYWVFAANSGALVRLTVWVSFDHAEVLTVCNVASDDPGAPELAEYR